MLLNALSTTRRGLAIQTSSLQRYEGRQPSPFPSGFNVAEAMNNEGDTLQELDGDSISYPNPFGLTEAHFGVDFPEDEGDLEDLMREMKEAPPWADVLSLEMDLPFGSNSNIYATAPPTLSPPQQSCPGPGSWGGGRSGGSAAQAPQASQALPQPSAACLSGDWQLEDVSNGGELFLEVLLQSASRRPPPCAGAERQSAFAAEERAWVGGCPPGVTPQGEQEAQSWPGSCASWEYEQPALEPLQHPRDRAGDSQPEGGTQPQAEQPQGCIRGEQRQQGELRAWARGCPPWGNEQQERPQAQPVVGAPVSAPTPSPMQCQQQPEAATPRCEEAQPPPPPQQQQPRWGDPGSSCRMPPPYPPPPFCFAFYPPPGYPPFYGPPWQHMGGLPMPPHMAGYGPPPGYGMPQQYRPPQQPAQQQQASLLPPPSPAERAAAAMQPGPVPAAPQCGAYGMPPQGQQPPPSAPWQYLPHDAYGPPPPCFPFGAPWMGCGGMPFPPMAYAGCQQAGLPLPQQPQQPPPAAGPSRACLPSSPTAVDAQQQQELSPRVFSSVPGSSPDLLQAAGGSPPQDAKWQGLMLPPGGQASAKYEPGSDVSDAEMEAAARIPGERHGSSTSCELLQGVGDAALLQPIHKRVPLSLFQTIPRQGAQPMLMPRPPVPPSASQAAHARMVRQASLVRYREKKARRSYSKTIRYAMRKVNADRRPRVKGRFVKAVKPEAEEEVEGAETPTAEAGAAEAQHDEHEELHDGDLAAADIPME